MILHTYKAFQIKLSFAKLQWILGLSITLGCKQAEQGRLLLVRGWTLCRASVENRKACKGVRTCHLVDNVVDISEIASRVVGVAAHPLNVETFLLEFGIKLDLKDVNFHEERLFFETGSKSLKEFCHRKVLL